MIETYHNLCQLLTYIELIQILTFSFCPRLFLHPSVINSTVRGEKKKTWANTLHKNFFGNNLSTEMALQNIVTVYDWPNSRITSRSFTLLDVVKSGLPRNLHLHKTTNVTVTWQCVRQHWHSLVTNPWLSRSWGIPLKLIKLSVCV